MRKIKQPLAFIICLSTGILLNFPALKSLNIIKFKSAELEQVFHRSAAAQECCQIQEILVQEQGKSFQAKLSWPEATILVNQSGEIQIQNRAETTQLAYSNDGRLSRIGSTRIDYWSAGELSQIDKMVFYYSEHKISLIALVEGQVEFEYLTSGKLSRINEISFEYNQDGSLKIISPNSTRTGIKIKVN